MMKDSKKCSLFGKKEAVTPDKTRDALLEQARKQFCEKGFEGASIRDICDGAGANVSAVKYHFGGKEGLYRECFRLYGENKLDRATKILTKVSSIDELKLRLKLFAEDFISEGLANMYETKMICRELETENPLIEDIFQETFLKVYVTLVEMIEDARNKKLIREDLDSDIVTSTFFHQLTTSLRFEHVGEKYFNKSLKDKIYLEKFINNTIAIIFDGIKIQE
jgi:AcrR family transcriptional regulator